MVRRFINAQILYYNKKKKLFELTKSDLVVENEWARICNNKKRCGEKEVVDCSKKIIIPIFINTHIHLGETMFRPLPHKMSLLEYITYTERLNIQNKENLDEMWQRSANETINESINCGVPILSTLRGNELLACFNIKAFSGYPIMLSDKLKKYCENGLEKFKEFCKNCGKNVIPGVFLHSLYYNNEESFKFSLNCFKYCKTFYATHVAEDEESEKLVVEKWGKRSVDILNANRMLTKKTLIIHGNKLTDQELKLLSKRKASLVVCPISAKNLQTKINNVKKLEDFKVNWCVATDGLATGESANLLIQTKELINSVENQALFKSITINPHNALGLKNEILSQKSYANFIIIDKVEADNVEDLLFEILSNKVLIKEVYFHGKALRSGI